MTSTIDHDLQALASANGAIILMRADYDALVEALRKARTTLGKIHVHHRSHITIGPFATECYAHIKMTCDHWPVVDELEVSIESANAFLNAALAKVAS